MQIEKDPSGNCHARPSGRGGGIPGPLRIRLQKYIAEKKTKKEADEENKALVRARLLPRPSKDPGEALSLSNGQKPVSPRETKEATRPTRSVLPDHQMHSVSQQTRKCCYTLWGIFSGFCGQIVLRIKLDRPRRPFKVMVKVPYVDCSSHLLRNFDCVTATLR